MGKRFIKAAIVVAIISLAPGPVAGSTSLVSFVGVAGLRSSSVVQARPPALKLRGGREAVHGIERTEAGHDAAKAVEIAGGGTQAPAAKPQAYTPPRTPDGKPDLQGIWQVLNTAAWDIQDHHARLDVPAGQGVVEGNEIPYQSWAAAKKQENFGNRSTADPVRKCYLPGVPRITYMPFPFQIFQTANSMVIIYEYVHAVRTIYTDRPHLPGHIDFWMGVSRGQWEGDTLVVDTVDFNDETWFDMAGNFHSDALHVVERYTRTGPDHITYEVTIEDPKVFTRPWKMSMPLYRRQEKTAQVLDYECHALQEEAEGRLK